MTGDAAYSAPGRETKRPVPSDPRVVFEDPIVYPGHEGHIIGVMFNECTEHRPTEPEDEDDEAAWEAFVNAEEAFYEDHAPLGDGDMFGCADTLLGDYCRTCYEGSDAEEDGDNPPLLARSQPADSGAT